VRKSRTNYLTEKNHCLESGMCLGTGPVDTEESDWICTQEPAVKQIQEAVNCTPLVKRPTSKQQWKSNLQISTLLLILFCRADKMWATPPNSNTFWQNSSRTDSLPISSNRSTRTSESSTCSVQ